MHSKDIKSEESVKLSILEFNLFKIFLFSTKLNMNSKEIELLGLLTLLIKVLKVIDKCVNMQLIVIETLLKESKGKYCVGDDLTLADAFLIP